MFKPYKYKLPPNPPQAARRENPLLNDSVEVLDRVVRGQKASDIEERLARALDKNGVGFDFQRSFLSPRNTQGEYRLDFLVEFDGLSYAIQPDGEYAHKSAAQIADDVVQDMQFTDALAGEIDVPLAHWPALGVKVNGLVARIPGFLLDDQDAADGLVEEMF